MHVASLRKKLGDPGWIETVRGVGFRFAAPDMTRRLLLSYLTITAFVLLILEVPLALTYATQRTRSSHEPTSNATRACSRRTSRERSPGRDQDDVQQFADEYEADRRRPGRDRRSRRHAASPTPVPTLPQDFSNRPEFADGAADRRPLASGTRHSDTLDASLLYVAVPVVSSGELLGAVRITFPTTEIDARVRRYWLSLAALGGVVLARRGRRRFRPRAFRHRTGP